MDKAKKILEYIKSRSALNVTALANEAGMNTATLANALSKRVDRDLPQKWVEPLEAVLRRYGYDQDQLVNALRDLHDLQNDAPLEKYRKQWEQVMNRIGRLLDKHEAHCQTPDKCQMSYYHKIDNYYCSKCEKTGLT